jgi:hypothetical protein
VIAWIGQGCQFFVQDRFSNVAWVEIVSHYPSDYVKTIPDHTGTDNLPSTARF